ncbi:MAG: hypothetical protein NW205_00915 [Hyphomicrobiaceae bacterium]|nr:hypothetical protein [Hyphomicrobiaceae bacterium]
MTLLRALILSIAGFASPAMADDVSREQSLSVSIGLRGGFDTDPLDEGPKAPSAGFMALDGTVDYANSSDSDVLTFTMRASGLEYDQAEVVGSQVLLVDSGYGAEIDPNTKSRTTTKFEAIDTLSQQSRLLSLQQRFERDVSVARFAVRGELRHYILNEQNALLDGAFLDEAEEYRTLGVLPSIVLPMDKLEVGLSAEVSRSHFANDGDLIGFDRAHDIWRRNVFFAYRDDRFALEGSASPTTVRFPVGDYDTIETLQYTGKATATLWKEATGPRRIAAQIDTRRVLEQTTFPLSVYQLSRTHGVTLAAAIDAERTLAVYARQERSLYLGIDILVWATIVGAEFEWEMGNGYAIKTGLDWRTQKVDGVAEPLDAINCQIAVTKKFDVLK